MKRYRTIIAGYDGSPCSQKAILEAMRIAGWSIAPLWIYRAMEGHDLSEIAAATLMDEKEILRSQERRDNHVIEALSTEFNETEWHHRVRPGGDPTNLLLGKAEEKGANLVVIGSHGHSHEETGVVGTFAKKTLRLATIDVLLVREVQVGGFKKIVVLLGDGGDDDVEAFQRAKDIADHEGADFEALSCYPSGWSRHLIEDRDAKKVRSRVAEGLAIRIENLDALAGRNPGDEGEGPRINVISSESPSTALLESLTDRDADLVVVSAHLSNDRPDVERVVAETKCSVLMVAKD